jgi:hypothetical protein
MEIPKIMQLAIHDVQSGLPIELMRIKMHFVAPTGLGHEECHEGASATKCLINEISYTIFSTLHLLSHFKVKINNFHFVVVGNNCHIVWKIQIIGLFQLSV